MTSKLIKVVIIVGGCWIPTGCTAPGGGGAGMCPARRATRDAVTPTGGEPYHGMIQYRAKDAKVAIVEPELVAGAGATLAPGTKVIGVFIGGEARAYPLFMLNNHQVVNDKVGGIPVSASW